MVDQERPVRQLISFPPERPTRQQEGFVRQRNLVMELDGGTVYHLSLPYRWDPVPEHLAVLTQAIQSHDRACPHREHIASVVSWFADTQVEMVDLDLSAPTTAAWPLRAAALQQCFTDAPSGEPPARLAQRVAVAEAQITSTVATQLMAFVANLNPEILCLSALWGGMPWARYNWFAGVPQSVRTYRIQLARIFPALVPVLAGEAGPPSALTASLTDVIDRGGPLIEALARLCQVRKVTAKHALSMPALFVSAEKLPTLIRALDWLAPERFPRQLADWASFDRLVHRVIPKLTNRHPSDAINFSFLPEISRSGWDQLGDNPLADLFVDDAAGLLVREFLDTYQRTLVWAIEKQDTPHQTAVRSACARTISDLLAAAGVISILEASRAFAALLRDAERDLSDAHSFIRGERWESVLEEPMVFEDCTIVPLLTVASLSRLGGELDNCIGGQAFATACARSKAHIFSIQDQAGTTLGALHIHFPVNRSGVFEVSIDECKGPHNTKIGDQGWKAVKAFCDWLKTDAAQRRIAALRPRAATKKEWIGLPESLEMEVTIAALGRLRKKSMRFDVLRGRATTIVAATGQNPPHIARS